MTPEQYERVRSLFLQARDKPIEERAAFLDTACHDDSAIRSEVDALLNNDWPDDTFLATPPLGEHFLADNAPAFRPRTTVDTGKTHGTPASPAHAPEYIGRYRILNVLGEGGMGVVYRAEQERPQRIVALKVLRPGFNSYEALQRFRHEAQVLGWLQHPGIAQIYEAGTADTGSGPQPFFALELVHGATLTDFARQRKLAIHDRLVLFARVCDAIHHAHQKGIIHRDLKPGNIIVDTSGQPKVLDFGVARVTDADLNVTVQTVAGQIVGTLAYMSPEQVSGDSRNLDTRADVYALGVILYELLTGATPIDITDLSIPEAARAITERTPQTLRHSNRALRGDIETIVAKALEKDKERRYASAAALADDVRRHLSDQPIAARPATTFYQLRKFTRRHRTLVTTVVAALIVLSAALTHMTLQRNRAIRAEQDAAANLVRAAAEAEKAGFINRFYTEMLRAADPARDGRDVRVVDVLEQAAEHFMDDYSDQPVLQATLQNTIGIVYIGLGLFPEAEPFLRSAVDTRRRTFGDNHPETLEATTNLAGVLEKLGRWPEAETLTRRIRDARSASVGPDHVDTLNAANNYAEVLYKLGRISDAADIWQDTLARERRVLPADHALTLVTLNNLAQAYRHSGRDDDAVPVLRDLLARYGNLHGDKHPNTLTCMSNLAGILGKQGNFDEAERLLRHIVEVRRRELGTHPSTLTAINNLARLLQRAERFDEAERGALEVVAGHLELYGAANYRTVIARNNLATLWVRTDRPERAEPVYAELVDISARILPPGHFISAIVQRNYGECLTKLQEYARAEELLLEAHRRLLDHFGPDHEHTRTARERIVTLYQEWNRPERAAAWERAPADTQPALSSTP